MKYKIKYIKKKEHYLNKNKVKISIYIHTHTHTHTHMYICLNNTHTTKHKQNI